MPPIKTPEDRWWRLYTSSWLLEYACTLKFTISFTRLCFMSRTILPREWWSMTQCWDVDQWQLCSPGVSTGIYTNAICLNSPRVQKWVLGMYTTTVLHWSWYLWSHKTCMSVLAWPKGSIYTFKELSWKSSEDSLFRYKDPCNISKTNYIDNTDHFVTYWFPFLLMNKEH